jgi:cytochrome b561
MTHKPPAILTSYKTSERKLATGAHHLLYLLMLAIPLSGLTMSVASKYGVKWFGLKFISGTDNESIREVFYEIHEIAGLIILMIVVLHMIGALKHKFIDKDDTMKRIMP